MKKISTRIHGVIDYLTAIIMIALPWLLNFQDDSVARNVTASTGVLILVYSLVTRYEMGIAPLLTMRVHLGLDVFVALFTIASPWMYRFSDTVYLPHVLVGVLELIIIAMSDTVPGEKHHPRHQPAHH